MVKNIPDAHSALFVLHESLLEQTRENSDEKNRILQALERNSDRARSIAEAAYADTENFHLDLLSPFLPLSLFQAGLIQYRIWKQNGDKIHKERLDSCVVQVRSFTRRWLIAGQFRRQRVCVTERDVDDWQKSICKYS
jgi:hypothetical protein